MAALAASEVTLTSRAPVLPCLCMGWLGGWGVWGCRLVGLGSFTSSVAVIAPAGPAGRVASLALGFRVQGLELRVWGPGYTLGRRGEEEREREGGWEGWWGMRFQGVYITRWASSV